MNPQVQDRIGGVDQNDNKITSIWTARAFEKCAQSNDELWETSLKQAIFPAYRVCQERLARANMKSEVARPIGLEKPFVVLFWEAQNGLAGARVGLQLTYGGAGKFAFDVSAVRIDGLHRHQTSFYQEYFSADEPYFASKLLERCGFGMGLLSAMELAPQTSAEWRSTVLEKPRWLS